MRPLLSITFPQGFRISKNIGHPTSGRGGKKTVKRYLKSEQTDKQTDRRTDKSSYRKHQPKGPMLTISQNVHMFVCLSVCLSVCSLLRYLLTVFLPQFPKVRCPIFFEIRNPWGKVMERSCLTFQHFIWKWPKITAQFFCCC